MSLLDELKKRQMNGFAPAAPAPMEAPAPVATPAPAVGPTVANAPITFPGLNELGAAGAAEFNAPQPETYNAATPQVSPTSPAPIAPSAPTPQAGSGGLISFDSGARAGQTFFGDETGVGAVTPATAQGISQGFDETYGERPAGTLSITDAQGQSVDPNRNRFSPEFQTPEMKANIAAGRPLNVSASQVAGAERQMQQQEAERSADRAAEEYGKNLPLGGGSIGERDEKIANYRAMTLAGTQEGIGGGGTGGPKPMSNADSLALRKYEDTLAKEAAGTPLTPSEELARDRFEYEKEQDTAKAAAGPAKTSTERNIDRLMEANPNMSRSEAINIEQGAISKTVNPLTGATEMTNIATGESTPVKSTEPLPDASLNLEPAESGTSLFDRGQKYTGAIEAGLRAGQKVAGQFGGKIVSDESTQTKKELDAFQGSLVRAFQEGDRFSTGQDKVLREELDATLGAMKDPETFKNNAIALDKVMRQRHADLIENYKDTTMDSDFRADSRSKSRVLERAIRDLGVTQEADVGEATESATIPEGVNKAFSQEMWDVLTPEERATLQGGK